MTLPTASPHTADGQQSRAFEAGRDEGFSVTQETPRQSAPVEQSPEPFIEADSEPERCPKCRCATFADVSGGGWRCVECKQYFRPARPTAAPSVEQRHRDAAARYESWRSVEDLPTAFARFDTERTATLEREIAALRENGALLVGYIEARDADTGNTRRRPAQIDAAMRSFRARTALGGQR